MRLYEYLVANKYRDSVQKDMVNAIHSECGDFLKEAGSSIQIYRGTNKQVHGGFEKRYPRTDRHPKDTPLEIHAALDQEFKKRFGWSVRSEGAFTSNYYHQADEFGRPYNFFPLDGYKYVYNEDIVDLTAYYSRTYGGSHIPNEDNITSVVKTYKDTDIKNIHIKYGVEITFYCPNGYYLIENDLFKASWSEIYKQGVK